MMKTDVLIIGSGIAGLSFALKLAERTPNLAITLVAKTNHFESNTKYAQGGIAAVMDNVKANFESHISDTLKAGKGFSNVETVRMVVEKAPKRLEELITWGVPFDKTVSGDWDYGLEGGHSVARILHHKDQTGFVMEKALLDRLSSYPNIVCLPQLFATNLLVEDGRCYGAQFLNEANQSLTITAKITYLATGGSGQVFSKTTNPVVATGDGVAIALRAGAEVAHMAFYQFHPTTLAVPGNPMFLITEALRGFGAHLINHKGERFTFKEHPDGELATRDVVSKAIFNELKNSNQDCVWLDCRHLDPEALETRFPTIVERCKQNGIDVFTAPIPIVPAAHYQCGGVKVNQYGQTSIKGLYANGECAATGLHGSNRLASNSLLEAVVFAHEAAVTVIKALETIPEVPLFQPEASKVIDKKTAAPEKLDGLKAEIKNLMNQFITYKYLNLPLDDFLVDIEALHLEVSSYFEHHKPNASLWELKNIAAVAKLIVNDTLNE
ncbi:L-aspartate oxidase [Mangrovimonas yunxiaonensis]|uniref:L-aspartate oxidase n=1 Tax=Mangrovimonas yunxiaonensis TaxID=1197477 RepID=UPI00055B2DF7|nr:L-aspartate oxidase [Mangrovimonas yunxiaonensis]GGH47237.1 L-aspartate oxidase [Mangrovimonas yunxiaonensis]